MIHAKDISLKYNDGTKALKSIDLNIKQGEIVYIVGQSGSGKTSLLNLILGSEYPTKGSLIVLNEPIKSSNNKRIRLIRRKIGPIFQDFKLINGRTVLENVILGMRFLDIPSNELRKKAKIALKNVSMDDKVYSLVENLSWGEQQRVSIARAVCRKPKLILADEPTGNLDKENSIKILNLLSSFRDEKTSVIITTHASHLLEYIDNYRLIELNNGEIFEDKLFKSKKGYI